MHSRISRRIGVERFMQLFNQIEFWDWNATLPHLVFHGPPAKVKVEAPQRRLRPQVEVRLGGAEDLLELGVGGVGVPGSSFSGVAILFHGSNVKNLKNSFSTLIRITLNNSNKG